MVNDIVVKGIQTNNLRNIDVELKRNAINLIIGPSGSGKSSLAYDTIAQIGLHELGAMYSDGINEPQYKVQSFSNMVVTIPIKQLNSNNNVRSTIGTYFSLNPCLAKIYSSLLGVPYDYFVLNKSENVCHNCMGLGYIKQLDPNKIIDYDKTIEEVPIRCWKKNKDFYRQILELFCDEQGIPKTKKFRQLSEKQKFKILYETSDKKYKIKYKVTNHESTRTTYYYGPMTEMVMLKSFSPSAEFYSELKCEKCNGEKYEAGHRKSKICGYSIGEVMLLPFNRVVDWIKQLREKYDCKEIDFSLNLIETFVKKACELNLGYLFINRNIPSLSGGELQRLRLIQVFSSQLNNLLIVLDEPLAGLSKKEKKIVYQNVLSLEKKHTLLIVDHHELFYDVAKKIYALGEGGGKKGGKLIDSKKYIESQRKDFELPPLPAGKIKYINIKSDVYAYKGIELRIADNRLNVISGSSGVGKSTLLREYFPQVFDNYMYINQKPMGGSVRSTVATDLDIATKIILVYAKKFKKDKKFFSNMSNAEGVCRTCAGTGVVTFGSQTQSQICLECKDCRGTGFDRSLEKYKLNGKDIQDIWKMTIEEGIDFFTEIDQKIVGKLMLAQSLLLGHLQIGEKTSDLSGGENIRMKLVKALSSNNAVIGIDEPFKGLNNEEIYRVAQVLSLLVNKGKTIIVVDHEENSFKYFTKHIELVNKNGILTEE
ncbi:MAG: ATP-binding cassette domain-containing protein [Clostridiaceae bacterium]|nr:ATP-binding cassette domain-containing protein [Clostridiaceae bacterium]